MLKMQALLVVAALAATAVVAQEVVIFPREETILREEGETLELTCRVVPKYVFSRVIMATKSMVWLGPDGKEISSTGRVQVSQYRKHALKLVLSSLAAEDSGLYQCRVQMTNGVTETAPATEIVQGVSVLIIEQELTVLDLPILPRDGSNATEPPGNVTEPPPGNETLMIDENFQISLFNDSVGNTTELPPGNETELFGGNFQFSIFNDSSENTTEGPPGNDTLLFDGNFHISLFNDSIGNTTEPPPGNETLLFDGNFHMSLFNDSVGNTTEPPPGNETLLFDGNFHMSLFNDSIGNTTEPPPGNETVLFGGNFQVSLFNDSIGNTTEPPPGNETVLFDGNFQVSLFNDSTENGTTLPPNTTAMADEFNPTADCSDLSGTWYASTGVGRLLLRQNENERMTGLLRTGEDHREWFMLRGYRLQSYGDQFKLDGVTYGRGTFTNIIGECSAFQGQEALSVQIVTYEGLRRQRNRQGTTKTFYRSITEQLSIK